MKGSFQDGVLFVWKLEDENERKKERKGNCGKLGNGMEKGGHTGQGEWLFACACACVVIVIISMKMSKRVLLILWEWDDGGGLLGLIMAISFV